MRKTRSKREGSQREKREIRGGAKNVVKKRQEKGNLKEKESDKEKMIKKGQEKRERHDWVRKEKQVRATRPALRLCACVTAFPSSLETLTIISRQNVSGWRS